MFIARAEAAGAANATGGPPSEVDKYKAALLMAVREKQVKGGGVAAVIKCV